MSCRPAGLTCGRLRRVSSPERYAVSDYGSACCVIRWIRRSAAAVAGLIVASRQRVACECFARERWLVRMALLPMREIPLVVRCADDAPDDLRDACDVRSQLKLPHQSPVTVRPTNGTSVDPKDVRPRNTLNHERALSARITMTESRKNAATAASR